MNKTYEKVTDAILDELRQGTVPWVKPWKTRAASAMPYNAVSKREYSGVNIMLLWATAAERGYEVPGWLTYKQATQLGGHVRKGEKGTMIVFMKKVRKTETDEATGEEKDKSYSMLRGYVVFNVAQCDGLPEKVSPSPVELTEHERNENAETFLSNVDANVHHGGDRAFYSPSTDHIQLPEPGAFETIESYYATSLHEHGHWTGAKGRLDRAFGQRFGDEGYAAEELVAELTAAFLCAHLGLRAELRHAGYIESWIKLLGDHKQAIFTAASQASKAADYLRGIGEPADLEAAA